MVSINTNLSSIMVQGNLNQATNGLNKAIERLSTGYKINHSSDNAANYSIANNYEAKLSSYDMAASNVGMGSDLLAVAQDTISSMQDHGARLHALITQARNGTYGAQSLNALTQEAGALISEIQRMYTNAEYNKVSLFDNLPLPEWAKEVKANAGINLEPKYNGFIADAKTYTDEEVAAMTKVSDVESFTSGQKYSISSKEELAKLATKVNGGTDTTNVEFVLANDIDLSSIENWDAIGQSASAKQFKGTFDGNGHVIKNLKIDKSTTDNQGLFGYTAEGSTIKNVGIVDCDIKGRSYTSGLVGLAYGTVTNSYATGAVTGTGEYTGGLVGLALGSVTNSYATGSVIGTRNTGGLVGHALGSVTNSYATGSVSGAGNQTGGLVGLANGNVTNSYATGSVTGTGDYTGGLVGVSTSTVTNSYASGAVSGTGCTGGLLGVSSGGTVTNSYATGSVTGTGNNTGGLVGLAGSGTITNSYATGSVIGTNINTGGLVGYAGSSTVTNSYATGSVTGTQYTGGLVGQAGSGTITNSYATGDVSGSSWVGGLVGQIYQTSGTVNYDKLFSSGKVSGDSQVGSLIGGIYNTDNGTSFGTVNITNAKVMKSDLDVIGFEGKNDGTAYESGQMSTWLENIKQVKSPETTLQVGIHGDESSKITFNTGFSYDLSAILRDIKSDDSYNAINKFMSTLSDKATELGSVSNRLESALDSIIVNMENITSSLSTIKDADMATESSQYIKMQILQQASATLLATANQSPSIALQLI